MKRVLVTGGAGYIGSHACKALAAAGYLPVAYDNLVYGHEWAVKWGPFEHGDILDTDRLRDCMARHRPEAVMHFAAFAYVGESVANPAAYYRNNIIGTLSLLEAMGSAKVQRIVFSSSCAVYGVPASVPITEDTPQHPVNPYGATKMMAERILADYRAAYGLKAVCLRYFNAAGGDPDGETGESHDPETHLIPLLLDAAAGARAEFTVFGSDYDTPDGTCIRDFIHVGDLANAHVAALQNLESSNLRPAYNLGTGTGYSILEVAAAASEITGRPIPLVHGARRPGDPGRLIADATRARDDLGWTPKLSDIATIIETAWAWRQRPGANR